MVLRFIGKRVVDILLFLFLFILFKAGNKAHKLLVLIELFRQVLRLRRYERISVQNWRFRSNPRFQVEGVVLH